MNVVDFLSEVVTGWGYNMHFSEVQYVITIAGINLLVMVVEKVFGLFAIVLKDVKSR